MTEGSFFENGFLEFDMVKCSSERSISLKAVTFLQDYLLSLFYIFVALEAADCLQFYFFSP